MTSHQSWSPHSSRLPTTQANKFYYLRWFDLNFLLCAPDLTLSDTGTVWGDLVRYCISILKIRRWKFWDLMWHKNTQLISDETKFHVIWPQVQCISICHLHDVILESPFFRFMIATKLEVKYSDIIQLKLNFKCWFKIYFLIKEQHGFFLVGGYLFVCLFVCFCFSKKLPPICGRGSKPIKRLHSGHCKQYQAWGQTGKSKCRWLGMLSLLDRL